MHVHIFYVLMLACCGYALARGGAPERLATLIFVAAVLATVVTTPPGGRHYDRFEASLFGIDLACYASLQVIAARADRFWTIWAAGLQLATVMVHLVVLLMPTFVPFSYSAGLKAWPYGLLILLAIGTQRHRRRVARHGRDDAWN